MTPSQNCIDLIKKFEGLKLKSYQCSAKVWTIGYGSTIYPNGSKVKQGDTCTIEQAEEYLRTDVSRMAIAIMALLIPFKPTQSQFDAVLSFAYNVGLGSLGRSTLLRKLKAGDRTAVDEFAKWNKADGRVLAGLTRRRKAEAELFVK